MEEGQYFQQVYGKNKTTTCKKIKSGGTPYTLNED